MMKTERVPAKDILPGDRIRLIGSIYFTVEWAAHDTTELGSGGIYLAGTTSSGRPHISSLSEAAMVDLVTDPLQEHNS